MINNIINEIINYIDNKNHFYNNLSDNAYYEVNNILKSKHSRIPLKLRKHTPMILINNGIEDLPMYENPSHIRSNILSIKEAIDININISKRDHYHSLGIDLFLKTIDSLDNSSVLFKYARSDDDYLFVTSILDSNGNQIVIPIETNATTIANNKRIKNNRIKSVYGYDKKKPNLREYLNFKIDNKELIKINEKKEHGAGNSTAASSFSNLNISNNKYDVKHVFDELLLLLTVI